MKEISEIKKLFNTNKSGVTFCFSLVCWTDGMWSIKVTDDWHEWSDKKIPRLDYKYAKPEQAIKSFLEHIEKHKIDVKALQEKT